MLSLNNTKYVGKEYFTKSVLTFNWLKLKYVLKI